MLISSTRMNTLVLLFAVVLWMMHRAFAESTGTLGGESVAYKRRIELDELRELWKEQAKDPRDVRSVEGYVVRGEDIVSLAKTLPRETRVFIERCEIEGALFFTDLPRPSFGERLEVEPTRKALAERASYFARELESVFRPGLTMRDCVFKPGGVEDAYGLDAQGTLFLENILVIDSTIEGVVRVEGCLLPGELRLERVTFEDEVQISNTYCGGASVDFCDFLRSCSGSRSIFGGPEVRRSTFKGGAGFRDCQFREAATDLKAFRFSLEHVAFHGPTEMNECNFATPVTILNTNFLEYAGLSVSTFKEKVEILDCRFQDRAYFAYSDFHQMLNFPLNRNRFHSYIDFGSTRIASFQSDCSSAPGIVNVPVNFRDAAIGRLTLASVEFAQRVDFTRATLGKSPPTFTRLPQADSDNEPAVIFDAITFRDDCRLRQAVFGNISIFNEVYFRNELDLRHARSDGAAFFFNDLEVGRLRANWNDIPPPEIWIDPHHSSFRSWKDVVLTKARPNYRQTDPFGNWTKAATLGMFAERFQAQGQIEDWNRATFYRKEMQIQHELADANVPRARKVALRAQRILWGCTTGYGTNLHRILLVMAGFFVASLLFFRYMTVITRTPLQADLEEQRKTLQIFRNPFEYIDQTKDHELKAESTTSFVNVLWFTFGLLFKIGTRSYRAKPVHSAGLVKSWIVANWLLGYILLVAFATTVANTVPPLYALLAAIF